MASDKLGACSLFPNGSVKWSVADLVAVHQDEAITLLADQLVEFLLIGLRGQSVAGNERRAALLLPDRRVVSLVCNRVAADTCEAVALAGKFVEFQLIGLCGQSMTRNKGRS